MKLISTTLFCFIAAASIAQYPMNLKFRVTDDAKNVLKGMTIRLYDSNEVLKEIEKSKSLVEFKLEKPSIYTIEVELKGFVTKRVSVVTDALPEDHNKDNYRFNIAMERALDYHGYTDAEEVLEFPSAIVNFDTNSGVFDYNETYLLSTKKAFEKLYHSKEEIKF
ncbi:hypothetical protein OAA53_00860 [Salibacteraceae bacterium]|nr:hypothetical protein [Salibacteraceae bacterium]